MILQTLWVDRIHKFDFPAGVFPSLYERFVGTPARIEEMIENLPGDNLSKRINNKWSVKEHIGHLTDLEDLHETRLREFIDGKDTLSAADMTNKKTEEANHNQKSILILLSEFRKRRMNLANELKGIDEKLLIRSALHPRLQKQMRLVDMIFFVCEHDDHHLAAIRSIITTK